VAIAACVGKQGSLTCVQSDTETTLATSVPTP
jgi:hypothetical protein